MAFGADIREHNGGGSSVSDESKQREELLMDQLDLKTTPKSPENPRRNR